MVDKVTVPVSELELIDKVNELIEDKQDVLTAGTDIEIVRNILPNGYTQVEYLKATGTQLIDTGISGGDDDLVIDIVCKYGAWVQYGAIFGNWVQDSDNSTRIITTTADDNRLYVNYNNLSSGGTTTVNAPKNTRLHIVLKKGSITVNGVTTKVLSDTGTANNNVIALFNRSVDNPANRNIELEVESYFVTKNNVVIQNLIPCRRNSDNVLGMYDTVSQTFLTNAGTGTFTAGADVPSGDGLTINFTNESGYITGITSSDVTTALGYTPQEELVSGTNIKTINNESILGSGNIAISGGTWGNITGTLSDQTDLQDALDLKLNISDVQEYTASEIETLWGSI